MVVPLPIYTQKHHDVLTSTSHRDVRLPTSSTAVLCNRSLLCRRRLFEQRSLQVSSMASYTNSALITVTVVLLQVLASSAALVKGQVLPGLTITVENEFAGVGQKLDVHCTLNGKDLGQQSLMPFNRFVHKFDTSFFGNDLFTCTFAAAGKPTTTIDVFRGFSYSHRPCECLGMDHCFWQALNEGFWCNSKFIQNWG